MVNIRSNRIGRNCLFNRADGANCGGRPGLNYSVSRRSRTWGTLPSTGLSLTGKPFTPNDENREARGPRGGAGLQPARGIQPRSGGRRLKPVRRLKVRPTTPRGSVSGRFSEQPQVKRAVPSRFGSTLRCAQRTRQAEQNSMAEGRPKGPLSTVRGSVLTALCQHGGGSISSLAVTGPPRREISKRA